MNHPQRSKIFLKAGHFLKTLIPLSIEQSDLLLSNLAQIDLFVFDNQSLPLSHSPLVLNRTQPSIHRMEFPRILKPVVFHDCRLSFLPL